MVLRATSLVLFGDLHHLAQHHRGVAVEEGDPAKPLAGLERRNDEGLLRLEAALGHLVGLQGVDTLGLLSAGLLSFLPRNGGKLARSAARARRRWGCSLS